jgi:hypothetical protein
MHGKFLTSLSSHFWLTSPCPRASPYSPAPADGSPRPRRRVQRPGQDVPSDVQACQSVHDHVPGHARAWTRPVTADLLSPSPFSHALSTSPATFETCSPARASPVAVVLVDVVCRSTARRVTLPAASDHHFPCHDARDDRRDALNSTASSPTSLSPCSIVAMVDLPVRLGTSSPL